jgi:hypothetical protein
MHSRILRRALDAMADTATLLFASTPIRVCVLGWALVVTMSVQSMSQAVSARTNTGRLLPTPPAVVPALTPPATQSRRGSSPDQGILIADVDENLPRTTMQNPDAVAVIIGNAAYEKTKPVTYAIRDAGSIQRYLEEVFGYRAGNIIRVDNAKQSDFLNIFGSTETPKGRLFNTIKPGVSDVFIYYSGHGAPGINDHRVYFVPTDCDPLYVGLSGYPVDLFYSNLAKIPARTITVVLEACFSGTDLFDKISPAGILIKSPAMSVPNAVVLTSSSEQQPSVWYDEARHGLFTYFFLKAIHGRSADGNSDGKLSVGEIHQFVSDHSNGVPYYARRTRGIDQMPTLLGTDRDRILVEYAK